MEIVDAKTEMSQQIGKLAEALAKAQADMPTAPKDAKNPHFKNSYASFESIVATWKNVGPKLGLSISQLPISDANGGVGVRTVLMHVSGEYLVSTLLLKPTKGDPQSAGSALTYAKRYAYAAVTGMPTGEADDDAETATGRGERRHDPPARDNRPSANDGQQSGTNARPSFSRDNRPSRDAEETRSEAFALIADTRTVGDLEKLKARVIELIPRDHPSRAEVIDYMTKRHAALSAQSAGAPR